MPNWKKVITSGSDAALASISVTGNVTASGNISSSGTVTANEVISKHLELPFSGDATEGSIYFSNGTFASNDDVPYIRGERQSGTVGYLAVGYEDSDLLTVGKNQNGATVNIDGTLRVNSNITASGNISSSGTITGNSIVGTIGTATQGTIDHDSLANFVANEHIDHSAVSVIAGTGLTGGGTIAANRTLNVIGGTGVTANANDIAIGQDVATEANVLFNHITASANISASGTVFAEKSLSGAAALPNSTFALAGGSTSAISLAMVVSSSIGQVLTGQATSENINAGQLVYKASNGRMGLADADATSTSTSLLGIALNTVTAGNLIDVLLDGVVTILSPYITAGSIGNPLYVDTTAGSITNTAPSGENDVVRIVGHYINSGTGFSTITFKPDGTWVEL